MHDETPDMVSVTRCAQLLTEAGDRIDRSALSRYCDTHGLKRGQDGKSVLVSFAEVQAHRRDSYSREVMSGGRTIADAPTSPQNVTPLPAEGDPTRALKRLQLRREEREEAIAEGQLASTAEMDAGIADAMVEMRTAFAAARPEEAERLAAELGLAPEKVRILRAGLKRYDRAGQDVFARRMARAVVAANEMPAEAHDRLQALAAMAIRLRSASAARISATI